MPFFLPLLLSALAAGGTAYGDWANKDKMRREYDKFKPPDIDFGQRRANLASQAGAERAAGARGMEMSMAGRGLNDSGAAYSAGRGVNMDVARQHEAGMANLEAQEQAARERKAQWDWQKAQAMGQTGVDWLGAGAAGLGTFASTYPLFNPKQFMPDFSGMIPQNQQQPTPQAQPPAISTPQTGMNKVGGGGMGVNPMGFGGGADVSQQIWWKMFMDRLNNMQARQQQPESVSGRYGRYGGYQ